MPGRNDAARTVEVDRNDLGDAVGHEPGHGRGRAPLVGGASGAAAVGPVGVAADLSRFRVSGAQDAEQCASGSLTLEAQEGGA